MARCWLEWRDSILESELKWDLFNHSDKSACLWYYFLSLAFCCESFLDKCDRWEMKGIFITSRSRRVCIALLHFRVSARHLILGVKLRWQTTNW
jgi:hypothetical protein